MGTEVGTQMKKMVYIVYKKSKVCKKKDTRNKLYMEEMSFSQDLGDLH